MKLDLNDKKNINDFVKNFKQSYKSVDFLINNAGVGYYEDIFLD